MNVENIHKGRNKNFFLTGVGILDFLNFADSAVCAGEHAVRCLADRSGRITEELDHKDQKNKENEGNESSDQPPDQHVIKIAAPMIPQPSLARMGYEEFDFKPFLLNRFIFRKGEGGRPSPFNDLF